MSTTIGVRVWGVLVLVLALPVQAKQVVGNSTPPGLTPGHALDCSVALLNVAMAFKQNDPAKVPAVLAAVDVWMNRMRPFNQQALVNYALAQGRERESRWIIDTAMSCRKELDDSGAMPLQAVVATSNTPAGPNDAGHPIDCAATLGGVALAYRQDAPARLATVEAAASEWLARLAGEPSTHFPAVADRLQRLQKKNDTRRLLEHAWACHREMVVAGRIDPPPPAPMAECLGFVTPAQKEAARLFEWAAAHATLARGTGGDLGNASDAIRRGCLELDSALRRMEDMRCPAELVAALRDTRRAYRLDIPGGARGTGADVALTCP